METTRLYEKDPYIREFQATVAECIREGEFCRIMLDQTAFYPEGGGQPADHGTINGIPVTDVQERDHVIWHYTDHPLNSGELVVGKLDWDRRLRHMQNHSGEHIVSGIIYRNYGYHNVGFHMGTDVITIDLDGILTEGELWEIEEEANAVILSDLPVEVTYPSREVLAELEYRSKKEIEGQVRLVTVPGVDCCACCGTHVSSTREIRLLKFLTVQKYKSGVRISMLSGEAAYADYQLKHQNILQIARLLSLKPEEAGDGVVRLKEKNIEMKKEIKQLKKRIFDLEGGAEKYTSPCSREK